MFILNLVLSGLHFLFADLSASKTSISRVLCSFTEADKDKEFSLLIVDSSHHPLHDLFRRWIMLLEKMLNENGLTEKLQLIYMNEHDICEIVGFPEINLSSLSGFHWMPCTAFLLANFPSSSTKLLHSFHFPSLPKSTTVIVSLIEEHEQREDMKGQASAHTIPILHHQDLAYQESLRKDQQKVELEKVKLGNLDYIKDCVRVFKGLTDPVSGVASVRIAFKFHGGNKLIHAFSRDSQLRHVVGFIYSSLQDSELTLESLQLYRITVPKLLSLSFSQLKEKANVTLSDLNLFHDSILIFIEPEYQ